MSDAGSKGKEQATWSVQKQLDQLLDRFEAAWSAGEHPSIEQYLSGVSDKERPALLRELLALELAYRVRMREHPSHDEYSQRFPAHAAVIREVFAAASKSQRLTSSQPARSSGSQMLRCSNGHRILLKGANARPPSVCPICKSTMPVAALETMSYHASQTNSAVPEIAAPATSRVPKKLGRFELLEMLGEGAFGMVFHAKDPQLDREVAIKVPRAGEFDSQADIDRFFREARAAAQLQHPHIVPVFEAGNEGNSYYIVCGFVKGTTLRQEMKDRRFTHQEAAKLLSTLAIALHHAHTQGVIHRDIKPANIMMDSASGPHIMDFGLARRTEGEVLRTQEGSRMGTPAYMSPEQAAGQSHLADARSDLWSLGVILYEILAGKRPFDGDLSELMVAIQNREPTPPRRLDDSIPKDLETICLKCLAKDRKDRFPSCRSLAEELDRWQRGEPIEARPVSTAERAGRWAKRNPVLAGMGSAMAALVLVVAGVIASSAWRAAGLHQEIRLSKAEQERQERIATDASKKTKDKDAELKKEENDRKIEQAKRKQADEEKELAMAGREESERLRLEREKEAKEAMRAAELAERAKSVVDYAEAISQVEQAIRTGQKDQARNRLEACVPEHRSWEWGYLRNRSENKAYEFQPPVLHGRAFSGRDLKGRPFDDPGFLVLSPDGRTCASLTHENNYNWLVVWDVASGRRLRKIEEFCKSAAFSPDGRTLVAWCDKSSLTSVILFDVGSDQRREIVSGVPARFCAFSPDVKTVALGDESTIILFDTATGEKNATIGGELEAFIDAAWSPDGKRLATAAGSPKADKPVGKGTAHAGTKIWNFGNDNAPVSSRAGPTLMVAWSPDGKYLASIGQEAKNLRSLVIKVTESASGNEVFTSPPIPGPPGPFLAWAPDSKRLAMGNRGKWIEIWDIPNHQPLYPRKEGDRFSTVSWSPQGDQFVTGSLDKQIKIWNAATGEEVSLLGEHGAPVNFVRWTADGRTLVSSSTEKTIRVWRTATGDLTIREAGPPTCIALAPDGSRLAAATTDRPVRLFDATSGQELLRLSDESIGSSMFSFSPDGKWLASCGSDKKIRLWNVSTGEAGTVLEGHSAKVNALAFGPDGTRLASASADKTIRLWNLAGGNEPQTIKGHTADVTAIVFTCGGDQLVSGDADGTLKLWDIVTTHELFSVKAHESVVAAIACGPVGDWLGSLGNDATVKLWNVVTGEPAPAFQKEMAKSTALLFTPDGKRLVWARDNHVELSDAGTGRKIISLEDHRFKVLHLALSADAKRLASADSAGNIKIRSATLAE